MFWKKKSAFSADEKNQDNEENSPKMGMLQRLAMKKVMSMDPKERERLMQKALAPENIEKNKDKILETMKKMKDSGQLTEDQFEMGKKRLGIE